MIWVCFLLLVLLLLLHLRLNRVQKRLDAVAAAADQVASLGEIDV